jgi:hypothetical protein
LHELLEAGQFVSLHAPPFGVASFETPRGRLPHAAVRCRSDSIQRSFFGFCPTLFDSVRKVNEEGFRLLRRSRSCSI